MKKYDVIVIGSGMAGMTIANKCAKKGLKTAITDSRPYGGTCALRGCDPKKILVGAAEIIGRVDKMSGIGISGDISINWEDLMAYKNDFVSKMPKGVEKGYEKAGVKKYHGVASFESENTVRIGNDLLEGGKIVIATGARPVTLDITGGDLPIDSTDFLNLEKLPEHITFVGGGYIAMEFAHLAARAGSKITIFHRGERPLENFDEHIVKHLVKATKDLGILLHVETEVIGIEKDGDQFIVFTKSSNGEQTHHTDLLVNAAGRVPELDGMNLEKASIAYNKKGIEVNEYLQSESNPTVYAAGDAANSNGLNLTPVAVMEGHAVAANIIRGNSKVPDYTEMPSAVFTLPTLAAVGMTEKQAKELDVEYQVKSASASNWYNAKRINESTYAYKVISHKDGHILGAHIIGPHAEEMINLFAMAIRGKLKVADIRNMVYSYPSMGSDIGSMV
ncbi:dihydrolipoyl dehydrogenase family protein [Echinicola vietnamensis]|uniref:Pyruvate/2-oxoglutarate dehydrogenase complex, dihydrolipoamide dehydrogenase component n=1 Tax=Echinicola vietnamensis (strain DSM 17526 / LMG 23754 / KMM 6221) TaxID=926556 RepID=L0G481_ECHVK|nr:NAD(P)/FAD-dependent oxidoreductase [Echinicola vietnamensis]AGA80347.1 pyruvate/2-oxoglutarate dehydrogenase complex, dihydrolipoamide dehydrogenase component [Echinicola vietnamensis DSM 17526]